MLPRGCMQDGMVASGFRIAADTCKMRAGHHPADIGRITAFVPDHATAVGIRSQKETRPLPGSRFREGPKRRSGFPPAVAGNMSEKIAVRSNLRRSECTDCRGKGNDCGTGPR